MNCSVVATKPKLKHPDEEITYAVDFSAVLQEDELLVGTPTVSVSPDLEDDTIDVDDIEVTTATIIDDDGNQVPAGEAVTFKVVGGLSGADYRLTVEVETEFNGDPGNVRVGVAVLQVRDGRP